MGGLASAIMVALGYPGEIQDDLVVRLNDATAKQPQSVRGLVGAARYLTVISWLTYPFVYIIKNIGLGGSVATAYEQVGYSLADVIAKAVFGVLIWSIAAGKSEDEEANGLIPK